MGSQLPSPFHTRSGSLTTTRKNQVLEEQKKQQQREGSVGTGPKAAGRRWEGEGVILQA